MSVNYGSKRTVVGAHYGLRDWLSQRVTAALMVLFTVVVPKSSFSHAMVVALQYASRCARIRVSGAA